MSAVSSDILGPSLQASSFCREYCLKHPLKYFATRYTEKSPNPLRGAPGATPISILVGVGAGNTAHLWIPLIKHLFALQHKTTCSPVHILSVWVVDRPNHGDAGVLNQETLKKEYADVFLSVEYAAAISEFLSSDLLEPIEKASLVAVGHSASGGALVEAFPCGTPPPYKSIIFVDGPLAARTPEVVAVFNALRKRVKVANARLPASWPSLEAAMAFHTKRKPWSEYDAECQRILSETYFRDVPGKNGAVATKLTPEQLSATWLDTESSYSTTARIGEMLRRPPSVPMHFIVPSVQDLWPEAMAKVNRENLAEFQSLGLGVTVVNDVGHNIPHEKPQDCAQAVFEILCKEYTKKSKL